MSPTHPHQRHRAARPARIAEIALALLVVAGALLVRIAPSSQAVRRHCLEANGLECNQHASPGSYDHWLRDRLASDGPSYLAQAEDVAKGCQLRCPIWSEASPLGAVFSPAALLGGLGALVLLAFGIECLLRWGDLRGMLVAAGGRWALALLAGGLLALTTAVAALARQAGESEGHDLAAIETLCADTQAGVRKIDGLFQDACLSRDAGAPESCARIAPKSYAHAVEQKAQYISAAARELVPLVECPARDEGPVQALKRAVEFDFGSEPEEPDSGMDDGSDAGTPSDNPEAGVDAGAGEGIWQRLGPKVGPAAGCDAGPDCPAYTDGGVGGNSGGTQGGGGGEVTRTDRNVLEALLSAVLHLPLNVVQFLLDLLFNPGGRISVSDHERLRVLIEKLVSGQPPAPEDTAFLVDLVRKTGKPEVGKAIPQVAASPEGAAALREVACIKALGGQKWKDTVRRMCRRAQEADLADAVKAACRSAKAGEGLEDASPRSIQCIAKCRCRSESNLSPAVSAFIAGCAAPCEQGGEK